MFLNPSALAVTRRRSGGAPSVTDPVTDPTFRPGRDTLAGSGAQGMEDAVEGGFTVEPDSATITGGTNADHWQIVDDWKLSPSATGRAAGLLGGPSADGIYTDLAVTYTKDGQDFPHTVRLETVEDEYSVASKAESDAAIADKGTADKGLLGASGHTIRYAVARGQSNGQGPAAHDGGTTHPSGTFQWFSSSWPNNNVIEEISDTLIQQHDNSQTSGNMGPDIGFSERFHELFPNSTLILVGACKHATAISLHEKHSEIFADAKTRVNALRARHPNFIHFCDYWAQGESDGQSGSLTTQEYADIGTTVFDDIREAVYDSDDTAPIVIMGFTPTSLYEDVKAAFPLIAARVNYCSQIDTTGLGGDSIHYNASGLREGGRRLCDAGYTMAAKSSAPTITGTSPADGAATVNANQVLVAEFSTRVQEGAGDIVVRNLTDATEETISLPDSRVGFSGATVLIRPTSLVTGKSYAVQMDPGAVQDIFGNDFDGISDDTTWNFTTDSDAALEPADWCDELPGWLDASDPATITHTANAVTAWASKGTDGQTLTASGTEPTYDAANNIINFDGSNDRLDLAAFTDPGARVSLWWAVRSGDETGTQIWLSKSDGASGPYIYMRNDASKGLAAGASINVHPIDGALAVNAMQLSGKFFEEMGAGTPGDYIVEMKLDMTNYVGLYLGGVSSFRAKFGLRQLAITIGCDTLEKRANMLAYMQAKSAA